LRDALEQQAATSDVLKVISRSKADVQPVFDSVVTHAVRLCAGDYSFGYLRTPDGFRYVASAGGTPELIAIERRELQQRGRGSMVGRVAIEERAIHIPDVLEDDEYALHAEQRAGGFRTLLGVPMKRDDGEVVGVIGVARSEVRPFTSREIQLVETFADQAAIAIENVRLFTETKEALERQTAIGEILRAIAGSPTDIHPVLEAITASAIRFCAAEDALVMLPEGQVLRLAAHTGPVPIPDPLSYALDGSSMSATAFAKGRVLHIRDLQAETGSFPAGAANARASGYHTVLVAPLLREGTAIGTIGLRRSDVRPFTDRQIDLLRTFADQAVIAIENVRLFNEIREKSGQLAVANDELAAASRHKSEFLANMSHELRTPLNAIIGFSDVLEQRLFGELNERQSDYTRDIASSGRHLLDLVNEILDLSKVEAGRMALELSEFALADTIRGAVGFVRERAATHRIALGADLPADLGTVVADERKVRQVLLNLLSNAVKFTPDGGTVAVRAWRGDGEVEVSVRDTGIGIAPEDQATVFDEFQQVGKPSDRSREGTGLGLTLAKRFIELHGGRIWIESEVGKGTTFTFAFPVAPSAAAPA
jgi:signal transduction histidine kinase